MRELVREHRLDLPRLQALPEALGHRDGGVLRSAARGERIRDVRRDDGDARLRQVCERAQPLDHRAGCGERELVRRPVLNDREPDDDDEHRHEADVQCAEQHERENHVEQPEQTAGQEHAHREAEIASE